MIRVFEEESRDIHEVFEPDAAWTKFMEIFNDREQVSSILSNHNNQSLQRLFSEEVGKMAPPIQRRMLQESGSAKNFAKIVMGRVVARLVADKLVKDYGPAVLGVLGIGAAGTTAVSGTNFFADLPAEQQEMFRPFFEGSPLLQEMSSHSATQLTEVDSSEVIEHADGILDWLSIFFS